MRNYITLALLIILFGFTSSPYDSISKFDWNGNAWALVQQDGLYGFIDVFGEEVVKPKNDKIDRFNKEANNWAKV